MSLRSALRGLAGVIGGAGLAAAAEPPAAPPTIPVVAPPAVPVVTPPVLTVPPDRIPPADAPPPVEVTPARPAAPVVARVTPSAAPVVGSEAFPKMLAESRAAYAKLFDYAGHMVRQEKVGGTLLPEQTVELRVRTKPFAVNARVVAPRDVAGTETGYVTAVEPGPTKVRYKAGGADGIRHGFQTLAKDDPKALAVTRHSAADTGLLAVLDRVDRAVQAEKRAHHPVQILVADYAFAGRPCTRYEVYAGVPHPARYAYRCVLCVDRETKLPVRWEAYDQPTADAPNGELFEVQSFVGVRTNTGVSTAAIER